MGSNALISSAFTTLTTVTNFVCFIYRLQQSIPRLSARFRIFRLAPSTVTPLTVEAMRRREFQRFGKPLEVGNRADKVSVKKVRGTFGLGDIKLAKLVSNGLGDRFSLSPKNENGEGKSNALRYRFLSHYQPSSLKTGRS